MTHTQVYILSRLTVSRDHTRKQIYPNKNSPHPPPQDINISATWLLHQRSLISNRPHTPPPPHPPPPPSPSPSPGNFPLMTTALKDLTLKAARHWVVNLILRRCDTAAHTVPLSESTVTGRKDEAGCITCTQGTSLRGITGLLGCIWLSACFRLEFVHLDRTVLSRLT